MEKNIKLNTLFGKAIVMKKTENNLVETTSPDVSLIIPVYKVEKYIKRCVCSIFEQSLKNVEFIFVDDCSPDCSIQLVENIIEAYPNRKGQVTIVRNSCNKGISAVRNIGLEYAKGKYIGWGDSDDWIDPEMCRDLYHTAVVGNSDIVWCDFYNSYEGSENIYSQQCNENNIDFIRGLLSGKLHGGLWCTLIKRELFIRSQIHFPEGWNVMEDKNALIKLAFFAEQLNYLPMAYYHYIKYNSDSITSGWDVNPQVENAAERNLKDIISFLVQSGLGKKLYKEINYAKLVFKKTRLNSMDIETFREWKRIFPEANRYVLTCPNTNIKQRILGWLVNHNCWLSVKFWIVLRNKLKK